MSLFTDSLIATKGAPAVLYGSDGVSDPLPTHIFLANTTFLKMAGTARGDILLAQLPSTVTALLGQVLAVPSLPAGFYVIARRVQRTQGVLFARGLALALLALPLTISYQHRTLPDPAFLNALDEPQGLTGEGYPNLGGGVTTGVVRAAIANQNNPLLEPATQPEGALPAGVTTLVVPKGAGLVLGDTVYLPDGTPCVVQQANWLDANGDIYALQLVADQSAGNALAPPP